MEYIAEKLSNEMFLNGLITEHEKEIYCYAVQVWMEKTIGLVGVFLLSIIWKNCLETIFFLVYFSCIRGYTGGYHAKRFSGCFFSSIGIYTIYVKLICPILLKYQNINLLLLLISAFYVFIIGAFSHSNMGWSKEEYEKSKYAARIVVSIEVGSILLFFLLGIKQTYILYMSFGVILSTFLLIFAQVIKNEVRYK